MRKIVFLFGIPLTLSSNSSPPRAEDSSNTPECAAEATICQAFEIYALELMYSQIKVNISFPWHLVTRLLCFVGVFISVSAIGRNYEEMLE